MTRVAGVGWLGMGYAGTASTFSTGGAATTVASLVGVWDGSLSATCRGVAPGSSCFSVVLRAGLLYLRVGVVAGAHHRPTLDVAEAHRAGSRLEVVELL